LGTMISAPSIEGYDITPACSFDAGSLRFQDPKTLGGQLPELLGKREPHMMIEHGFTEVDDSSSKGGALFVECLARLRVETAEHVVPGSTVV